MKKFILSTIAILAFSYQYSDNFNILNKDFWLVYDHGGHDFTYFPPSYNKALIENGILKLKVNDTDHGPELVNKFGIKVYLNSVITASWKAKVHYANEYFAGGVYFALVDYNTTYPPESKNYNISPIRPGTGLATVYYRNYFYKIDTYQKPYVGNNFGFSVAYSNEKIILNPIWDKFFTTKVKIDFPNKQACMWIDNNLTGCIDINSSIYTKYFKDNFAYLRIHFSPYGWWTGHEMDIDNFNISINNSNIPTENNISQYPAITQHFYKGWNLVGASIKGDNFNEIFQNYPVKIIWKWENGKWKVWSKNQNLINYLQNFNIETIENVKYFEGYWLFATQEFNLSR